jgi:hypothetical protein
MPENRLNNDIKIENTLSAIKDEIQKFSTQTKQNFERLVKELQTE